MANPYLTMVERDVVSAIETLKDLENTMEDFLKDIPHVDGLNGTDPTSLLHDAIASVKEAIYRIGLLNDYMKEVLENG